MIPPGYPFSAIVGHDRLRLALVLCAIRPEIGGVLIRGEKGTAKSTAARALAAVLAQVDPATRLVELPIGATEDRVIGSLDLQKVLRDGEHGLLHHVKGLFAAQAGLHRNAVNEAPVSLVKFVPGALILPVGEPLDEALAGAGKLLLFVEFFHWREFSRCRPTVHAIS